ncbi:hypothetical protein NQ314_019093 [Rhamnusium bicolor]|uniref:Cytochrome P450 n=1 Tax=Rhamnusium bicolor TaxID=1586634 RepID=A0AAV8WQD6_9CUCU|nr:hypothetical protein NQ314_019093 [Rhamnusium bicolor]
MERHAFNVIPSFYKFQNETDVYTDSRKDEIIELEMKNVFTRFTNDIIANCAFGIKCDSLKDETNQFFTMGSSLSAPRGLNVLRGILAALFPKVFKDTMLLREKENIVRPDMIHLLMEAKKGRLRHDNEKTTENETGFATVEESSLGKTVRKMELTDDMIAAQALVFFFAGFETSSTLLSFLSYELALNPDIQSKVQSEIDEAVNKGNGKVSYEDILKIKYLDQVISETLRKYPPGYVLTRVCTKDYKIEAKKDNEIDFVLEKGCVVSIPVCGIHMDPKYFPEPNKFDPDRFSDENKGRIVPGSYMPFGIGPRNCIG